MFIEVKGLTKVYQSGDVAFKALNNIDFAIQEGKRCAILGPSGSGKSTLLNILGGIDKADSGEAFIDSADITKFTDSRLTEYRRDAVGFVFQFYNLVPNLTVYENVEVAANVSKKPLDINDILKSVGMKGMENRFPRELSGGQQQRVSIARALVKKPKLLFCDEPTGALDYTASIEILKLLENINNQFNTTVLIITHNNAIAGIAHQIIRLRSGEIAENQLNENVISAERIEW